MIFRLAIAAGALALSAPAAAVTYIGNLQGYMTDGTASYRGYADYYGPPNEDYFEYDLAGLPMQLSFKIIVKYDYYEPYTGYRDFYEKFIISRVTGKIWFPDEWDNRVADSAKIIKSSNGYGDIGEFDENDFYDYDLCCEYGLDFTGNGRGASVLIDGFLNNYQNHTAGFNFSYFGATTNFGLVSGSGSLGYGFGYGLHTIGYGNFVITSGRVLVTDVPEPATWALMLIGFGAIGTVVLRRRGERIAITYA